MDFYCFAVLSCVVCRVIYITVATGKCQPFSEKWNVHRGYHVQFKVLRQCGFIVILPLTR